MKIPKKNAISMYDSNNQSSGQLGIYNIFTVIIERLKNTAYLLLYYRIRRKISND